MASNCPTEVSRSMHFWLLALALFPHLLRGELALVIGNFYASEMEFAIFPESVANPDRYPCRRQVFFGANYC